MKMTTAAQSPSNVEKLTEIKNELRTVCEPRYHEYHRDTQDYGFVKITMPKRGIRG